MIEQASLVIGEGNWAVKSDSLLGYKINGGKYYPREMSVVRATTGTRINEDGLVELVPYNLWLYSEQFDNAEWLKTQCTITANAITAPNGTLTADKITDTTANDEHRFRATTGLFTINGTTTFSIYAKAAEYSKFAIADLSNGYVVKFDLSAGTVISTGTDWSNATITNVGDGWYRLSATRSANATCGYGLLNDAGDFVFTGTGTKGVYIWGAQVVEGSSALDYLPTTDRLDVARIDYSSGSGALLVEPQRTNLATWSNDFSNAVWTKNQSTITSNYAVSPQGIQNASRWLSNSGATLHFLSQLYGFTLGVTYTISCYVKSNTSSNQDFRLGIDGGVTSLDLTATTEWQRFTFTANPTNAVGLTAFFIARPSTNAAVDLLIYGLQLEVGSYATSYIKTTSASVTRNADNIELLNSTILPTSYPFTMFLDSKYSSLLSFFPLSFLNSASSSNYYALFFESGKVKSTIRPNSTEIVLVSTSSYSESQSVRVAVKVESASIKLFVNGQLEATAANTLLFNAAINDLFIGKLRSVGDTNTRLGLNSAAIWATALTDAQCQTLTTI